MRVECVVFKVPLHMGKKTKVKNRTTLRGRTSRTGRFVSVESARRSPTSHHVERIPKPAHGDTERLPYSLKGEPLPPRNPRTGSFTTTTSTAVIDWTLDELDVVLRRLAKK